MSEEIPEKPLFIPLKREYFEAFKSGRKTEELRLYGPRWNTRTCRVGRRVVLSLGYGKQHRLTGTIWRFKMQHGSTFGRTYRADIQNVYGTLDIQIACISIVLESWQWHTECALARLAASHLALWREREEWKDRYIALHRATRQLTDAIEAT